MDQRDPGSADTAPDDVHVLRKHRDRTLDRLQQIEARKEELNAKLEQLQQEEHRFSSQLRGLDLLLEELTGEVHEGQSTLFSTKAASQPDVFISSTKALRDTARQITKGLDRQVSSETARRLLEARRTAKAKLTEATEAKLAEDATSGSDEARGDGDGDGEERPAVSPPNSPGEDFRARMQYRWRQLPRTDAIELVLQNAGTAMSPSDLAKALQSRGREEDTARLVSASLSHLQRQGRVVSAGYGRWVHPEWSDPDEEGGEASAEGSEAEDLRS